MCKSIMTHYQNYTLGSYPSTTEDRNTVRTMATSYLFPASDLLFM